MLNSRFALLLFFSSLLIFQMYAQNSFQSEELFGAMKARQIGPALMSGRVSDLVGHPSNSKIIYVGSAGGGVWKSINAGSTFSSIFDKHCQSIGTIAIDPTDPDNTIWVGTGETWTRNSVSIGDGIYKSSDAGKTWKHMGLKASERISDIVIHPSNPKILFVGVLGGLWNDSEERGVYISRDGGESWERNLYINAKTGCSELIMDPVNPDIMYAAFWEFRRTAYSFNSGGDHSALYKTTDGGKNWIKIHNGFPSGKLGRIALALAPSNSNIVYAVLETEKPEDKGLYRSDDGGQTWKRKNGDFELVVRPFYFSRIVIDPKNPDIVLKGGFYGSISKDGGATFKSIGGGMHPDLHDFWFDPNNSDIIFAGTDGGVYRSWDGGTSWEMVKNLPLSQFYHVQVDRQKPYRVYGGLQDNGSWFGPSTTPSGVQNRDWISVGYGDGFRVYPDPDDPNIVYSEMQGAEYIWRVHLDKNQYKIVKPYQQTGDPKLRFNWNTPILTSIHQPGRIYAGSQFLHVSDDRGDTWRKISPDLTTNDPSKQMQTESGGLSADNSGAENHCTIFTVAESPLDASWIWVGTDDGNIQLSTNGGTTWNNMRKNISGVPDSTWVYHVAPSYHKKERIYAVLNGHTRGDFNPYVMRSEDAGKTWINIAKEPVNTFVRCIAEDLINPDLLYLGTEFGLFISIDGGSSWLKFENNVPAVAIHHIVVHPDEPAVVLATHGRGIIIIDDIRPLRALVGNMSEQEFVFFPVDTFTIDETNIFDDGFSPGDFIGPAKSTSAKIVYYMNKRHTFGKMTMEIFDMSGNKIADLLPGKSRGINYVSWNGLMPAPKMAKGKTLSFNAINGPHAPAGSYKVVVTKGSKMFETTLNYRYDENSPHTLKDREDRNNLINQLHNELELLAYHCDRLLFIQNECVDVVQKIGNTKDSKKLKADIIATEIDALLSKFMTTTGDNYVGRGEPRLRENLAALYDEIKSYEGSPGVSQKEKAAKLSKELSKLITDSNQIVVEYERINTFLASKGKAPMGTFMDRKSYFEQ